MQKITGILLGGAMLLVASSLRADDLYGMGSSSMGELGNQDWTFRATPVQVATGVASVAFSADPANANNFGGLYYVDTNHNLYILGDFLSSYLPHLVEADDVKSVSVGYGQSNTAGGFLVSYIRTNGELVYERSVVDTGVAKSSCGMNCCLYVKTDGSLWGIGSAMNGCFGQGSAEAWSTYSQPHHIADNIAAVSAGRYATLYLTTSGDLYGMGMNSGTIVPKSADLASAYLTPVLMETGVSACQIGEFSSYYLKSGTLYRVSSKNNVKTSKVVAENVTTFSIQWAGYYDADKVWFTKSDGSLWAWGSNRCGSLGTGNLVNISTPVKIVNGSVASVIAGYTNNYYITTGGVLMGTGTVSGGCLGNRNEDFIVTTPRLVAKDVSAACGSVFTFILTNGRILQGLGGYDGALQFGRTASQAYSLAPWQIATGVTEIAANTYHGLYVRDGVLYGVGANNDSQLGVDLGKDAGNNAITFTSTPVQIDTNVAKIAAGETFSLYLKTDGSLYATGSNSSGQLGVSVGTNGYGIAVTPVLVDTGVVDVSAGAEHSLYLKADGSLYATGKSIGGQLGVNLGTDGNGNAIWRTFTPQKVDTGVTAIAAGGYHSLYLKTDGSLFATGDNSKGQLGVVIEETDKYGRVLQYSTTPLLVDTGVTAIAAGDEHSLYLRWDGALYSMGDNRKGQLGVTLGDNVTYTSTPQYVADCVTDVFAGTQKSYFLKKTKVSCYGPGYEKGAKWDDVMGWVNDTHLPWVWDYSLGCWYYVYAGMNANPRAGYWIGYYTSGASSYGWAYVYPETVWKGLACLTKTGQWRWIGAGEPLP